MYLVFDVGATTIKYAWMSADGDIIEKGKATTPLKPGDGVEDFVETIGEIYDRYKDKDTVEGIAMGIPGQIDVEQGIVYNGGGIKYLDKVCLKDVIGKRCDGVRVALENDGKCAALAEVWMGNAKDVNDACVLVFGTGIGGAVIKDRKVVHGKHLLAGEVSFIFEDMTREDFSNLPKGESLMEKITMFEVADQLPYTWATKRSAINMCYRISKIKNLPLSEVTGEKVYEWARQGDEVCIDILEDTYFSIAKQCLNFYVTFDPEVILIGGGISAEPDFIKGIQRYIDELKRLSSVYKDIRIDVCKYRNDSNLFGALYNFMDLYSDNV